MSRPQNVELKNVLKLGCSIFYVANIRSERSLKPQLNRRRQHTLKFTTLTATETPASAQPWGQLRRQLIVNIYIFKYLRILSNLLSIFFALLCSSRCSFDVRGRPFEKALYWSDTNSFGPRAYFVTGQQPAKLSVENIQLDDEGVSTYYTIHPLQHINILVYFANAFAVHCQQVYRCRVDFQNSPTRNHRINLTVIGKPDGTEIAI